MRVRACVRGRYPVNVQQGWGNETRPVSESFSDVRVRAWAAIGGVEDFTVISVRVLNIEEPPIADTPMQSIFENAPAGTEVGRIAVVDGDCLAFTCPFIFTVIAGNYNNAFQIGADGTVVVRNSTAINYEVVQVIAMAVHISDGTLFTYAMPRYAIVDINDAPVIAPNITFVVLEDSPLNLQVGDRIPATDEDFGQEKVRGGAARLCIRFVWLPDCRCRGCPPLLALQFYSIDNLAAINNHFKIGSCDGLVSTVSRCCACAVVETPVYRAARATHSGAFAFQIRVNGPIDFETRKLYIVTVAVKDSGVPAMTGYQNITIEVTNVNDPPDILPQTLYVPENCPVGTYVSGVVVASDQDGDVLIYELLAGDESGVFSFNRTDGQLRVVQAGYMDFEGDTGLTEFVLRISVADRQYVVSAPVTVAVADVNDPPHLLRGQTLYLDENSPENTTMGRVQYEDQVRRRHGCVYSQWCCLVHAAVPTGRMCRVSVPGRERHRAVQHCGDRACVCDGVAGHRPGDRHALRERLRPVRVQLRGFEHHLRHRADVR